MVGISNTALSYAIFYICVILGAHYLVSNLVGFVAGVLYAYYWSNKYVFKVEETNKRNHVVALIKTFVSYGTTGIILQSIFLYLLVEYGTMDSRVAQLICLLITVPLNFIINKYWSFKD